MRHVAVPLFLVLLMRPATMLGAQEWQAGDAIALISRAVEARTRRDTDTVLAGWQASARGVVRFTAEIDHGNGPIERVIRADELQVEVYGEAPNRSKQVITAWRDTTFQPTSIVYHRDHLGIIANDFGPIIRLGDGEEVRDVPHPLSPDGRTWYEFAVGDTLSLAASSGTVRVVRVRVRPRDPSSAGIVGQMLLDADRASLVELSFTFTAAAYRDATVAGITVQLRNALHEDLRWLPWRQSIAIRRAAPVMVLPLTTVIRAEWIIDDYRLGVTHTLERFRGAAIDGLRRPGDSSWSAPWPSPPDSLGAQAVDPLAGIHELAATLVRESALDGLPAIRLLAGGGVSRLVHANRVQGVALGAGVRWQAPLEVTLDVVGGVGTSDGRVTWNATMSRKFGSLRIYLTKAHEIRDMHQWTRRSGLANSLATIVDGSDAGDWYLSDRTELRIEARMSPRLIVWGSSVDERVASVRTAFSGFAGNAAANPDLGEGVVRSARYGLSNREPDGRGWTLTGELSGPGTEPRWWRVTAEGAGILPLGIEWQLRAAIADPDLPRHRGFAAGGAGSLPGTVPRAIGGKQLLLVEIARPWAVALPSPMGGRLATNALNSRLSPFVAVGMARRPVDGLPWEASGELIPVVGVRLDLWGPMLRAEAGWSPRSGGLSVAIDAHPDWWPVL